MNPVAPGLLAVLSVLAPILAVPAREPEALPYFKEGYPKAFWHRSPEAAIWRNLYPDFEAFERAFRPLDGMMPKVLAEEVDRTMCEPWIREYKKRHPETLMMLHYLGDTVTLDGGPQGLMPGHYIHRLGAVVRDAVSGREETSTLRVDPIDRLMGFRKSFRDTSDYIAGVTLCPFKPDGTPDWERGEYAGIKAIDSAAGTVTLDRGMFGRPKLDLPAGKTYIALRGSYHVGSFNFSMTCPRDHNGRACADIVVGYFGGLFDPGGRLDFFDGIQFDVMPMFAGTVDAESSEAAVDSRTFDMDGNGRPDAFDQQVEFVKGVREYVAKLRKRLPKGFLLNGDDNDRQATHGLFNGCESEGWPNLVWDWDQTFWSQGMNLQMFWRDRTARPAFNYVFQKRKGVYPAGQAFFADFEEGLDRVLYAVPTMVDAGLALWGTLEQKGSPEVQIPPDEIVLGAEMKRYWLGRPVGPPRRLGLESPDVLQGAGRGMRPDFVASFRSGSRSPAPVTIEVKEGELVLSSPDTRGFGSALVRWEGFDWPGGDLLVAMNVRAAPTAGLDPAIPRMFWLRITRPGDEINLAKRRANFRRPKFEDAANLSPQYISCYADAAPFQGVFYFRNVRAGPIEFDIELSGGEPLGLSAITVHRAADAMVREFEHGAVLINPSRGESTFDLAALFPGRTFNRIRGVQTPAFNNGQPAGDRVTLGERDAIFLIKSAPGPAAP